MDGRPARVSAILQQPWMSELMPWQPGFIVVFEDAAPGDLFAATEAADAAINKMMGRQ